MYTFFHKHLVMHISKQVMHLKTKKKYTKGKPVIIEIDTYRFSTVVQYMCPLWQTRSQENKQYHTLSAGDYPVPTGADAHWTTWIWLHAAWTLRHRLDRDEKGRVALQSELHLSLVVTWWRWWSTNSILIEFCLENACQYQEES